MPRIQENYFSLEGGLSYKTFLDHFLKQAKGHPNITHIKHTDFPKGDGRFPKPCVNGRLILVDLATEKNTNAKNEQQPAIKVQDENEAVTKRVVDRVAAERGTSGGSPRRQSNKARAPKSKSHSKTTSGPGASGRGKKRKVGSASRAIKKARDVFED